MASVNLTAISRTSNVVTATTASAHGQAVGTAIWIQGVTDTSYNGIYTIASVPTTTSLTYVQNAANGSSTGGTASTVKQVIVTSLDSSTGGVQNISCLFWFPVPGGSERH